MKNLLRIVFGLFLIISSRAEQPAPMDMSAPFSSRLQPVGRILNLTSEGYGVWDCTPVVGPDGKVHVFFTRFAETGEGWFVNFRKSGEIWHAVADRAEGPYEIRERVLQGRGEGFWDAYGVVNPRIYKIGKQYALFYTAYETPWPLEKMKEHIGILLSEDLITWRRGNNERPVLSPSEDPAAWDHQLVNNASLVQEPQSGRLRLYYRGVRNLTGARHCIGVAFADRVEGPWEKYTKNPVIDARNSQPEANASRFAGFEDPCVWIESGRFKMLVKEMGYYKNPSGAYFDSEDGLIWSAPRPGYGTADDTPQLLFTESGAPSYLFVNRHTPAPRTGFVFTLLPVQK